MWSGTDVTILLLLFAAARVSFVAVAVILSNATTAEDSILRLNDDDDGGGEQNSLMIELTTSKYTENKDTVTTFAHDVHAKSPPTQSPSINTNILRELLRPSSVLSAIRQELVFLNKRVDDIKDVVVLIGENVREDITGLQEDFNGLKIASAEWETDLQSSRDFLERLMDWMVSMDSKFQRMEQMLKTKCHRQPKRKLVSVGDKECLRSQRILKKNTPRKSTEDQITVDDELHQHVNTADNVDIGVWKNLSSNLEKMKLEMGKIKQSCADFCRPRASSCADAQRFGAKTSGIYTINPWLSGYDSYVTVFCDLVTEGGGWTVIQKRDDFPYLPKEDFNRKWSEYKLGFGDVNQEFWLGNEIIYALSNQEPNVLRIELESFNNESRFAEYSLFRVGSEEEKYQLYLGSYHGNAADSMGRSRNMMFSTSDADNDKWSGNCAKRFSGGWWFNNCHDANLNGHYHNGSHKSYADGINWYHWKGFHYSLKVAEMKIRPQWFYTYVTEQK